MKVIEEILAQAHSLAAVRRDIHAPEPARSLQGTHDPS